MNHVDYESIVAKVGSNLQRKEILPSEKAFAYKMKMVAMSHQGRKTEDSSTQSGWRSESAAIIGEAMGESKNQVRRYIRLTELIPGLLELVDDKKLKFGAAVEISYISKADQAVVNDFFRENEVYPIADQAKDIKDLCKEREITEEDLAIIMETTKTPSEPKPRKRNRRTYLPFVG